MGEVQMSKLTRQGGVPIVWNDKCTEQGGGHHVPSLFHEKQKLYC